MWMTKTNGSNRRSQNTLCEYGEEKLEPSPEDKDLCGYIKLYRSQIFS